MNPGQGALPGLSFADQCIERMRALFTVDKQFELHADTFLWDACLDEKGKRFLCRFAGVDPSMAMLRWAQLDTPSKMRLLGAWLRLEQWVDKHRRAIERWNARRAGL